jgi:hypothetical protein
MAKGQMRPQREKRKPKAEGKKDKVPAYMRGESSAMSAPKPEPIKIAPKK